MRVSVIKREHFCMFLFGPAIIHHLGIFSSGTEERGFDFGKGER